MEKLATALSDKTLKREHGVVLGAGLTWQIFTGDVAMVEAIIWPVLTFIGAVSGLHIAKDKIRG